MNAKSSYYPINVIMCLVCGIVIVDAVNVDSLRKLEYISLASFSLSGWLVSFDKHIPFSPLHFFLWFSSGSIQLKRTMYFVSLARRSLNDITNYSAS